MKVTQQTANLWQITQLGLVNCYLIREADGYTVVDTGIPGFAKTILETATRSGAPVRRILLTHGHGDHVGSVDAVMGQQAGLRLAISARDARLLRKDTSLDAGEPQTKIKGSVPGTKAAPTEVVTDGELYGSLRCIATPGHTPGHFCFLDERDGTLLAGDALVTMGGAARVVTDTPWFFPLPAMATWHRPTAIVSAGRLLEFDVRRVAPGHGPVVAADRAGLAAMVDRAAAKG